VGSWAENKTTILDAVGKLPQLPWALGIVVDETGEDTGFAVLRGSINGDNDREIFETIAATHRMIGVMQWWGFPVPHYSYGGTNYSITPRKAADNPWGRPEIERCEAWTYCARQPERFLPADRPHFLISNSDFVDTARVWEVAHGRSKRATATKRWDVICSFSGHWYDEIQKNWSLGRACIEMLAEDLNLSVLLLSRSGIPDVPRHRNVEVRPRLPWEDCIRCIARSRLALFPNHLDPSPRVITESLALDVPVVVNADILGGWKYVHEETGSFFNDSYDVASEVERCLASSHQPRSWLRRHYGRDRAARRLAGHLRSLGGADHIRYAMPTAVLP
jgi:hypothetical protein